MIGPEPLWMKCKHLHDNISGEYGFHCAAFPNGIPEKIIPGDADHREPYHNDKGIMFEPITD